MVFWKSFPLLNILNILFNNSIFKSLLFKRDSIESPCKTEISILSYNSLKDNMVLSELRYFLRKNFGTPPTTPVLDIPEEALLGKKDHILFVRDLGGNIAGCIRYHYLGKFISSKKEDIYCVDCFCCSNAWRKKGLGDYLLTTLHNYVNNQNIPYCMFLKEGKNLNIIHIPFYSSTYVYRRLENIKSNNVKILTISQAYIIIDLFREMNPGMFIIHNPDTQNQYWYLFKKDGYQVLICFQDTYQILVEDSNPKKMAWATAWIESPHMIDKYREEAAIELSNSIYPQFEYVWLNRAWIGGANNWKSDGPFHWYLYQWTSNINIKKSYCILN